MSVRAVREHVFVPFRPPDPRSYSYLLGLYLGDGCVTRRQLVIVCDATYPDLVEECFAATMLVAQRHVGVHAVRAQACIRVACTWARWPEVFPQHGPGRKHERPIVLEPWQREIVDRYPQEFLRGLSTPTAAAP